MAKKGKPPTLPEQLRQLADAIEDVTQPKKPPTTEESLAELNRPGELRRRLLERRERLAEEADEECGGRGDGAPTSPPLPPQPGTRRKK